MKRTIQLTALAVLMTFCAMSAQAIDRTVLLPYKLKGKAYHNSTTKTARVLNGDRLQAYLLGDDIASDGDVYYLPDKKLLVLENATIEYTKAEPIIETDEAADVNILLKGSCTFNGRGFIISAKGDVNISAWPDETAQLTLISPQTAIQCTKSLTLSQLEVECTESRYAFACNGATSVNSVMTFNNCTANLKAKKGLFKGFKDLLTVKCGLNYDEYEDQRIAYGKQERQLTQKEKPCLAIPIVNTDMIIPIDTRNETWTWLAERTKPVMAGEDEQADDDTSAIGSDEEESAPMIEDEQPTMESEEVAMVETEPVAEEEEKKEEEEDRIFDVPEQRPQFNGTNDELSKFLSETIQYPAIAHENGIQGRVYVSFVVEKDGSVSNIKVVRPIDPSLNKEAVRVIQASSGRWKPAMQRGVPVRSTYTMPVNFRLTAATN